MEACTRSTASGLALIQSGISTNYLAHTYHTPDLDRRKMMQSYLLDLIRGTWEQFACKFDRLWGENNRGDLASKSYWEFPGGEAAFKTFRETYLQSIFTSMVRIAGVKMLRRTMGFVSVPDLMTISNPVIRRDVEEAVIKTGMRWILEMDQIRNITSMIDVLLENAGGIEQTYHPVK